MGYERGDRGRYRDERGNRDYRQDQQRGYETGDRGFFERAGDEVRSWFGDDDAERRRRMDERYDERIDSDRYASTERGGYRPPNAQPGWYRSNRDEFRQGHYAGGNPYGYPDQRAYEGRQFDDGGAGGGYGRERLYGDGEPDYGYRAGSRGARRDERHSGFAGDRYRSSGGDRDRDEHGYSNWRDRQMSAFDRDYDEYRRENQSRFETEFATWRQNRQSQRDSLSQVKEHQEVVGSDGGHVGTVDHARGDHILLTKTDKDAGGHHHSIPSSWVASVGDKVQLSKTADEAKRAWRDAEERGGLFGRDARDEYGNDHREGRGRLNRSFSGTY